MNADSQNGPGGRNTNIRHSAFILVKQRNVTMISCSGKSPHTNPYLHFSNSIRRRMLDKIDVMGSNTFTIENLQAITNKYPPKQVSLTALRSALLIWATGTANSITRHSVCNGFDAWTTLYNRYVPLAQDIQHVSICELMSATPAQGNDIDPLVNGIDRITDLYVKAGPADDLSDKFQRLTAHAADPLYCQSVAKMLPKCCQVVPLLPKCCQNVAKTENSGSILATLWQHFGNALATFWQQRLKFWQHRVCL